MDLYIHSPLHLHGVVLNYLSTGTTLPVSTEFVSALREADKMPAGLTGRPHGYKNAVYS
jgi:hypothetical protein